MLFHMHEHAYIYKATKYSKYPVSSSILGMPREARISIPHSMWVEDLIYIYKSIYIYMFNLISPCCNTCWSVFFRFSISSSGDFINFPHLFDHFIKGLINFPKLIINLSKKCCQPICSFYHLVSSAIPSFPNLFLQLIITVFLQFSKIFPTCWCMLSFDFIRNSFTAHMKKNLSVIFWSFWNKNIRIKMLGYFSFWDLYPECIRVL